MTYASDAPTAGYPDAVVIGGGFYGARIALHLRRMGRSVLLLERETQLLTRASLVNQARVHNGYHYPRSILTALRSRANYARFLAEYPECGVGDFTHYYAVGRGGSKVTAHQFAEFCRRIGAPLREARKSICEFFASDRIEQVFEVREVAFDATRLRERVGQDLGAAGVDVRLEATADECRPHPAGYIAVSWRDAGGRHNETLTTHVLNCTYASLNEVIVGSGMRAIPLKREVAEMALVRVPDALRGVGITVMDGPFFSLMPYPPRSGLCTLSHVRYTPHHATINDGLERTHGTFEGMRQDTRFPHMMRDAARYLPVIRGVEYVDSSWEIKAIMPRSERDDSRPILLRESTECPGFISVLGAKIDSVYDVEESLSAALNAPTHGAIGA